MSNHDHPSNGDNESLIGEVASEFLDRMQRGEQPRIEDYVKRYPQIGHLIQDLFPAMGTIGKSMGDMADGSHRTPTSHRQRPLPESIGNFRVVRELGRGGMGIVYEATQESMDRRVALKVLPFASMLDPTRLARFKNEIRAAGTLDHESIVSIYSVGEDRGVHYYSMQLVRGHSLARVIAQLKAAHSALGADSIAQAVEESAHDAHLPESNGNGQSAALSDRQLDDASSATHFHHAGANSTARRRRDFYRSVAELGQQAALALQHAHEHGVVHRDIKPGNLLIDTRGHLWVADFGLARIEAEAGLTMTGDMLGTLRYMAPEQASGSHSEVNHRADIYSLGVTLYELVALRPAFPGDDRRKLIDQITGHEPVALRKLVPSIPAELGTIIGKAIEKSPADRYPSAGELAADLERFLDDMPIKAKPPTLVDRAVKWSRRHSDMAWAAVAVLILLAVGSTVAATSISRLYQEAESQRLRANVQLEETRAAHIETEAHKEALRQELYSLDMRQAFDAWNHHRTDEVRDILQRHIPVSNEDDLRTFPWYVLESWSSHPPLIVMRGHDGPVREVAVHPDGRRIVSVGDDGTIRSWDMANGELLSTIKASKNTLNALAISPDGRMVATGYNTLRRWDLEEAVMVDRLAEFETTIEEAVFTPDGKYVVAGSRDQPAQLIALDDKSSHTLETNTGNESFAITDRGTAVTATSVVDGKRRVRSWGIATHKVVRNFRSRHFSPDLVVETSRLGCFLITNHGKGKIWLQNSKRSVAYTQTVPARFMDLALSPDESKFVAACTDGMLRIWWLKPNWNGLGRKIFEFGECDAIPAHEGEVTSIAFIDDQRIVSSGKGGLIKVWEFDQRPTSYQEQDPKFTQLGITPDAHHLLRFDKAGFLQLVRIDPLEVEWTVPCDHPQISAVGFASNGSRFAVVDDSRIDVWNHQDHSVVASVQHASTVKGVALSPSGRFLAATGVDGYTSVWNVASSENVFDYKLAEWGRDVEFSPDGRLLALVGHTSEILIIETESWTIARRLKCFADGCRVAFHPKEPLLASAHFDSAIRVWDLNTADLAYTLEGHGPGSITSLAFPPSGKTLVSCGHDKTIRFWDLSTQRQIGSAPLSNSGVARQIAFSPNGKSMVSVIEHGSTRRYSLHTLPTGMAVTSPDATNAAAVERGGPPRE